jgi:hypothetical protein
MLQECARASLKIQRSRHPVKGNPGHQAVPPGPGETGPGVFKGELGVLDIQRGFDSMGKSFLRHGQQALSPDNHPFQRFQNLRRFLENTQGFFGLKTDDVFEFLDRKSVV